MKKADKKKLTIYPHPRSLQVLGDTTTDCNYAIEVFSNLIIEATDSLNVDREEWEMLADLLNSTIIQSGISAKTQLILELEDSIKLERRDELHGIDGGKLIKKLCEYSEMQCQAIVLAVRFFWRNHLKVKIRHDDWWTIPFRLRF